MKSKIITILTTFLILACMVGRTQNFPQNTKILSLDREPYDVFATSVSVYDRFALIGAPDEDHDLNGANNVGSAGAAYIMIQNCTPGWTQHQKIIAPVRHLSDNFGCAVAISGEYLIVGAVTEDEDANELNFVGDAGSAYIFERNSANGQWVFAQKLVANDRGQNEQFGYSVAIHGNIAVVGTVLEDHDSAGTNTYFEAGAVYVFERDVNGVWNQTDKVVASDRSPNDHFGQSISVYGTTLVVGANIESEDVNGGNTVGRAGSAYIFHKSLTGNWIQTQKIVAPVRSLDDYFGYAVTVYKDWIVAGAVKEDHDPQEQNYVGDAGSAYIFKRNPQSQASFSYVHKIVMNNRTSSSQFGFSTSIGDSFMVVGARYDSYTTPPQGLQTQAGSAFMFKLNPTGTAWNFYQKLLPSDRESYDEFGFSVAYHNGHVICGVPGEDEPQVGVLTNAGAAFSYFLLTRSNRTLAICQGDSAYLGGAWRKTVGTYYDILNNIGGCDSSMVATFLQVRPSYLHSSSVGICNGDSVWIAGQYRSLTGTYDDSLASINGCDSIVRTNLLVSPHYAFSQTNTICQGDTLYVGNVYHTTAGAYTDTLTALSGCDSIVQTTLTVLPTAFGTATASICNGDSIFLGGGYVHTAGTYADVFTSVNGCDSTVATSLSILPSYSFQNPVTICQGDSLLVGGTYYHSAGTYLVSHATVNGCDSTYATLLTVDNVNPVVQQSGNQLNTPTSGTSYQWLDCNNGYQPIPAATQSIFTPGISGSYAVAVTRGACTDTSACWPFIYTGENAAFPAFEMNLTPNPTNGRMIVGLSFDSREGELAILDVYGRRWAKKTVGNSQATEFELTDLPAGLYFCRFTNEGNAITKPFVKQ